MIGLKFTGDSYSSGKVRAGESIFSPKTGDLLSSSNGASLYAGELGISWSIGGGSSTIGS